MKNSLSLYQNQTWIISVSGGPDSMALLDMAYQSHIHVIALHVNYHKRDSALRDQMIVQSYCDKHSIKVYVYDAFDFKGNFQDEARRFRYLKLKETVLVENAQGVMVAHHKDDDLETLLFQITRKSNVNFYGLTQSTKLFGMRVDRPLLDYTKEELLEYCYNHQIEYGIDESNTNLMYTRNKIRKALAELTHNEKDELFKIKNEYNSARRTFLNLFQLTLNQTSISHNDYISLSHNKHSFLLEWLRFHTNLYPISNKFIDELNRQLTESNTIKMRLNKEYRLIKQYGVISLLKEVKDYTYHLDLYEPLDSMIKLRYDAKELYTKVTISKDSFPITIKNLRSCKNQLQAYTYTKLSRWFIKNKIPIQEREMWPLVFNHLNELIYILDVGYEHGVSTDTIDCYMLK
jgi:tRNA(Ile)-lysidine synthase